MSGRVLCLCCGNYYGPDEDCDGEGFHSTEIAVRVARYLRANGVEKPRPADVRRAVAVLYGP